MKRNHLKNSSSIEIKTWAILLGMGAFASVAFISVYRSAQDRKALQEAQNQAKVLQESLIKLNRSFDQIKSYTRNTEGLAESAYNLKDPIVNSTEILGNTRKLSQDFGKNLDGNERKPHYTLSTTSLASGSVLKVLDNAIDSTQKKPIEVFANSIVEIEHASDNLELIIGRLRSISTILQYSGIALNSIPSLKPVDGPVTSDFGTRFSPFDGKKMFHTGVDIAAPLGSSVRAPAVGKVVYVGNFASLGNTIVLDHGSGTSTRYGHLKKAKVKIGQMVAKGDEIGWVGMTGNTTGAHLHYEIWLKNTAVNPREFFFDLDDAPKYVKSTTEPNQGKLTGMGGD